MTTGTLYGVGTGPGDPQLVTRRAWSLVESAQVIAYPAPDSGESFARSIVAEAISPDAVEIPMVVPMRTGRAPAQSIYDKGAGDIAAHLAAGRDVVLLCEGDPLFYGSFMYLLVRLLAKGVVGASRDPENRYGAKYSCCGSWRLSPYVLSRRWAPIDL